MNDTASPEQIERQINDLRNQISHTLDAVQQKLSPGQLLDHALSYAKEGGSTIATNFGRGVRDNPVPAALLGISLGWLIYASTRDERNGPRSSRMAALPDDDTSDMDDDTGVYPSDRVSRGNGSGRRAAYRRDSNESESRTSEATEQARGLMRRASDAGQRIRERAADLTDRASQITNGAMHRLHDVRDTLSRSRQDALEIRDATLDYVKSNPLTITLAALAAGAVIGALLPRTRLGNEAMGSQRDSFAKNAKETASREAGTLVEHVQETIEGTAVAEDDGLDKRETRH